MEKRKSLYIWNDISKISSDKIIIHYEGKNIVGLDLDDDIDAVDYIDILFKRLEVYNEKLKDNYSITKNKKPFIDVTPKLSHIYLMKNIRNGFYKIGRSINPEYRERTLQAEAPEIELIFSSDLTYVAFEKKLHLIFKEKRIRGEWFNLSDQDVNFIKDFDYGRK